MRARADSSSASTWVGLTASTDCTTCAASSCRRSARSAAASRAPASASVGATESSRLQKAARASGSSRSAVARCSAVAGRAAGSGAGAAAVAATSGCSAAGLGLALLPKSAAEAGDAHATMAIAAREHGCGAGWLHTHLGRLARRAAGCAESGRSDLNEALSIKSARSPPVSYDLAYSASDTLVADASAGVPVALHLVTEPGLDVAVRGAGPPAAHVRGHERLQGPGRPRPGRARPRRRARTRAAGRWARSAEPMALRALPAKLPPGDYRIACSAGRAPIHG